MARPAVLGYRLPVRYLLRVAVLYGILVLIAASVINYNASFWNERRVRNIMEVIHRLFLQKRKSMPKIIQLVWIGHNNVIPYQ